MDLIVVVIEHASEPGLRAEDLVVEVGHLDVSWSGVLILLTLARQEDDVPVAVLEELLARGVVLLMKAQEVRQMLLLLACHDSCFRHQRWLVNYGNRGIPCARIVPAVFDHEKLVLVESTNDLQVLVALSVYRAQYCLTRSFSHILIDHGAAQIAALFHVLILV